MPTPTAPVRSTILVADSHVGSDRAARRPRVLGQVRVDELRCACVKLGVEPPVVLGYQDGEVEKIDSEEAARNLARLMRELKPAVVITHDPHARRYP